MSFLGRHHSADHSEAARLLALEEYAVLDTPPEAAFDRLTDLAAQIFQVPIALVSLIDDRRQWFKSCHGLRQRETDRSVSFCVHAIQSDDVLVVHDATQDSRFAGNPQVLSTPHLRFYAGAPLITPAGERIGTLCILDTVPRSTFSSAEQNTLQALAASVISELELRKAITQRRYSEAVSTAILETSPDAIITLDHQGVITAWNPAAEQLTGLQRQDMVGTSSRSLVAALNGETAGDNYWSMLERHPLHTTARFTAVMTLHTGGSSLPCEVTLSSFEVNERRVSTLVLRDLSEQEAARAELREQFNLLQGVMHNVPEMIYVKDLERRYIMINPAGAALFGRPVSAILGKTDEQLLPTLTAAASRARDEQVLSSGGRILYEARATLPDGRSRTFWSSKTSYQDGAGAPVGLLGVSTDITERKEAEATIRHHDVLLTRRVENAQLEILERLARAAEYRDDDTGEHMTRVGQVAAALARQLGLGSAEVELIQKTAPLHDVGKIGISDSILLKPGRLTAEEFEVVKTHTVIGMEILRGGTSPLVTMAETIAQTHHERWDGTGYPYGLAGEDIPLAGRIVAVADVLDALTHERPYKQAWSLAAALAEIQVQAGRQFDPQVVRALLQLYAESRASMPDTQN